MKKKILIVINSDLYVRNYIYTNSFKEILNNYDCYFIASNNDIFNKKKFTDKIDKSKFFGFIKYTKNQILEFEKFLYSNFLLNKNNSKTISYIINDRNSLRLVFAGEKLLQSIIMIVPRFLSFIKKKLIYFYNNNLKKNKYNYPINDDLIKIFNKINPDLTIYPMQDFHILSNDILRLSSQKKTLALIDNWDNLSSRGTHELKPNFITVWGKQTKKHAKLYQNYKSNNIFLIGTPRFEPYFLTRKKKIKRNFNFKYFLFLESFGDHNNEEVLKKLDLLIDNNKRWKNFKIIYRPHPWQKRKLLKLNLSYFSNVIIDPQLKSHYYKDLNSTKFQPNINYYPSLIKNAESVITGPTSMVIESTIFYKKTLLLGYQNNKNSSYINELKNYVHLENLNRLNNIVICKNLNKFESNFFTLMNKKINLSKIDNIRENYLFHSNIGYDKRLFKIVQNILNV